MKLFSLPLLSLLLLSAGANAQMRRGDDPHRPPPRRHGGGTHSQLEQLINQNSALREKNMKLEFCVRGLARKVIDYGSSSFDAGASFAQGRFSDFDISKARRDALFTDINQRCSQTHTYTEGL